MKTQACARSAEGALGGYARPAPRRRHGSGGGPGVLRFSFHRRVRAGRGAPIRRMSPHAASSPSVTYAAPTSASTMSATAFSCSGMASSAPRSALRAPWP